MPGSKKFIFPFGGDTYVSKATPLAARLASGSFLSLVDAMVADTEMDFGIAVVRPPGHHATADVSSGFCLFNNVAVAARHLQEVHGFERVAILDWDVHHGNGTEEIFAFDPSVLFISIHRHDCGCFFPGTGDIESRGKLSGDGYTVNVPLRVERFDRRGTEPFEPFRTIRTIRILSK